MSAVKGAAKAGESRFFLLGLVAIASLVLFFASSLRAALFRAGNDLAFFDQLVYLLSQGKEPISTTLEGVHIIGDHGAVIFYPIALLYVIYPSFHWLLGIQAIALSMGAIPLYGLSRHSSLGVNYSRAVAVAYVLYPAIFNINFYTEFRPETIAVPALIWAVWAAKKKSSWQLAIAIILTLSTKETLALTVVGLGFWLLLVEKRSIYGFLSIFAGVAWFIFAASYLIPTFRGGHQMAGTWHYESLGTSMSEIAVKIITNPQIFLVRALASDRLFYYLLLILPILLGLHWRKILALIPALPMLGLNILADFPRQRDLIHQYSLPIIPFLFIWLITSLAYLQKHRLRNWLSPRWLIVWAIIAWLALAKYAYFPTRYFPAIPNVSAVRGAIALIEPEDKVLTTAYIASAISHRSTIQFMAGEWDTGKIEANSLDTVLIGLQHLGLDTSPENAQRTINDLKQSPQFNLVYHQQDVFLFKK